MSKIEIKKIKFRQPENKVYAQPVHLCWSLRLFYAKIPVIHLRADIRLQISHVHACLGRIVSAQLNHSKSIKRKIEFHHGHAIRTVHYINSITSADTNACLFEKFSTGRICNDESCYLRSHLIYFGKRDQYFLSVIVCELRLYVCRVYSFFVSVGWRCCYIFKNEWKFQRWFDSIRLEIRVAEKSSVRARGSGGQIVNRKRQNWLKPNFTIGAAVGRRSVIVASINKRPNYSANGERARKNSIA